MAESVDIPLPTARDLSALHCMSVSRIQVGLIIRSWNSWSQQMSSSQPLGQNYPAAAFGVMLRDSQGRLR